MCVVCKWLQREKMFTIYSFVQIMFAASNFEAHEHEQANFPVVYGGITTWAVPHREFFRKHEGTDLSDKVLCSVVAIGKSHNSCFLFAYPS